MPTVRSVAVVGLGYVGLPTSLALHAAGVPVVGVDVSEARLAAIKAERVDLLPSDRARLTAALTSRDFGITAEPSAIGAADLVVICVPTPVDDAHVPDLAALRGACADVAARARPGQLILLTSTSYVGTTSDLLVAPLRARGLEPGRDVYVAFSPERVDPGNSAFPQDTVPRVVGGVTAACAARAAQVLRRVCPLVHEVSSPQAAEMTKLLENTFRAVNIALANEVSAACRELDLDVMEIVAAAATKPYGFMPFYPGPGVGGHCIPCDPHYLLWQMRRRRVPMRLVAGAMDAIATRPGEVVRRAREVLAERGRTTAGSRVLVVGVAYKPGVADVRESPALEIMARLAEAGAEVCFTDPLVDSVMLADGSRRYAVTRPQESSWDLVLVHTLPRDAHLSWVDGDVAILDASFRLDPAGEHARV